MKFDVKNRWTGEVQFTAEIDAQEDSPWGLKMGLAVKWAIENGADLRDAVLSGANLRCADLRDAVLSGANLRCADLTRAYLRGAYLRGADLTGAYLRGADLTGAFLTRAVLTGAVLRDADWVPIIPNIHSAVYEAASADGALEMADWHSDGFCGTTHCRAGWVTHLAGEAGHVMDALMGTATAAALIYAKSDPSMEKVPDFYASNEDALADMKRLAEAEGGAA